MGWNIAAWARSAAPAAALLALAAPSLAQEASRDRAELDAAVARVIFQNVLAADPNAFASRPRPRRRVEPPALAEAPAATGEASRDRLEFDAAAGRRVAEAAVPPLGAAPERQAAPRQRPVRVILPSPYGR